MWFWNKKPKAEHWSKKFAKVHQWLPSRRPTYKNILTGNVVVLEKVGDQTVTLRRSCGKLDQVSWHCFEKNYIKN